MNRILRKLVLVGLCFGAGGCNLSQEEHVALPPEFLKSDSLPIRLDTQATVRNFIRIGLGSISKGDFTDAQGTTKNGLIAGLWIYVRGDSSQDQVAKVHVGQRFDVAGYRFFVEGIQGGKAGSILLRVLSPK